MLGPAKESDRLDQRAAGQGDEIKAGASLMSNLAVATLS